MSKRKMWGLFLLALAAIAGSAAAGSGGEADRGAELLRPFKDQLQSALRQGLMEGPGEAIGVCRDKAPEIVESLEKDGVRMGRTSHRLRNPENTAPGWVDPILKAYLEHPGQAGPREVALPEGRYGYAEPIFVKPVCLACHGTEIPAGIRKQLERHYPRDEATGFEDGDFRGLFWVEYPTHK